MGFSKRKEHGLFMNLFSLIRKKEKVDDNVYNRLIGNSCEVSTSDKTVLGYARVESGSAEGLHLVYNRQTSLIEEGEHIIVTVYRDEEPAILVNATVAFSTSQNLDISVDSESELNYVRSSFRTKVYIPGRFYKGDPESENNFEQEVMIDDISINGVMLSCSTELNLDDIGTLEFRLPTEVMYVPVMIKRAVERQDNIYKKYGGEFCEPSAKQLNTISHFIFQLTTALHQLKVNYSGDYRLFRKAWNTIEEWEKTHVDKKPSMLNRYDRKSISGQNNYFKRKNFTNRGK